MCNTDKMYSFIIDDSGKTLGFCGSTEVKYADGKSAREGFTIFVCRNGDLKARSDFLEMLGPQ